MARNWMERFELETRLGAGAFAEVFRARDRENPGRHVALKVLRAEIASNPVEVARLEKEARLLAQFNDDRIVRFYDWWEKPTPAIELELVSGGSLHQRFQSGPMSSVEASRLFAKVARAMVYAYATSNKLHCDLKPQNILLTLHGEPKVADFGLARPLPHGPLFDAVKHLGDSQDGGTLAYLAPERISGAEADVAHDMFALAVSLFEVVVGRRPFVGKDVHSLFDSILHAEPPWQAAAQAGLTADLRRVLERALAKDAALRHPTLAAFAADLDAIADGSNWRIPASTVLVGRVAEMDALRGAWHGVAAPGGAGRTVVVCGEQGIGVSTLVTEFRRQVLSRAEQAPLREVATSCETFYRHVSGYRTLAAALRPLFGHCPAAERGKLHAESEVFAGIRDPGELRANFADFLDRAFFTLRSAQPFLMILENAHDADADTLDALRPLVERFRATRGMLVFTHRPMARRADGDLPWTRFASWAQGEQQAVLVQLARFGLEDTRRLLRARLPGIEPSDELVEHVQNLTAGHPNFVGLLFEYLRESGGIEDKGGLDRAKLGRVPPIIRNLIEYRLSQLSPELRDLLDIAAVADDRFDSDTLAAMAGLERQRVIDMLDELMARQGLIRFSGTAYHFDPRICRDVVLEQLGRTERIKLLHERMAAHLAHRQPLPSAALAHHLLEAGQPAEAAPHLLRAAREARQTGATERATQFYRQHLEWLSGTPEVNSPAALEIQLEYSKVLARARRIEEVRAALGYIVAHREGHQRVAAEAIHDLAWLDLNEGRGPASLLKFAEARRMFLATGDRPWAAACLDARGHALLRMGRPRAALLASRAGAAEREAIGNPEYFAISQANLGVILSALGRSAESIRHFERAVAMFRSALVPVAGDPEAPRRLRDRLAHVLTNLATSALEQCDFDRAAECNAEALQLRRATGDRRGELLAELVQSDLALATGMPLAAAAGYRAAARGRNRSAADPAPSRALRGLAATELCAGRRDAALDLLNRAIAAARADRDGEEEAWCLLDLARIWLALNDAGQATVQLSSARKVIQDYDINQLRSRLLWLEGAAERRAGNLKQARVSLGAALRRLARCPAPDVEWRVLGELAQLVGIETPAGVRARARARAILVSVAERIHDPLRKQMYLLDPERAEVLGRPESNHSASATAP